MGNGVSGTAMLQLHMAAFNRFFLVLIRLLPFTSYPNLIRGFLENLYDCPFHDPQLSD